MTGRTQMLLLKKQGNGEHAAQLTVHVAPWQAVKDDDGRLVQHGACRSLRFNQDKEEC